MSCFVLPFLPARANPVFRRERYSEKRYASPTVLPAQHDQVQDLRRTLLRLAQAKQNAVGRVAPGCAADRMLRSRVARRTMFMTENNLDRTCLGATFAAKISP